jgi:hypothetical protein
MASKFGEKCDFDVEDALIKLEKLEIVTKVSFCYLAIDFHVDFASYIPLFHSWFMENLLESEELLISVVGESTCIH